MAGQNGIRRLVLTGIGSSYNNNLTLQVGDVIHIERRLWGESVLHHGEKATHLSGLGVGRVVTNGRRRRTTSNSTDPPHLRIIRRKLISARGDDSSRHQSPFVDVREPTSASPVNTFLNSKEKYGQSDERPAVHVSAGRSRLSDNLVGCFAVTP